MVNQILFVHICTFFSKKHRSRCSTYRIHAGFWKVLEIENAFFQDLESFGKEMIFKMAMESFGLLFGNSRNILKWMYLSFVLNTVYVVFVHSAIYNAKYNPPKNCKAYRRK